MDAIEERLARLHRDGLLRDHRAAVEALVDEVHRDTGRLDTGCQCVVDRVRPRKLGQERRMDIDDALGKALEERLREQGHVTGEDDEVNTPELEPVRELAVACLTVGVAVQLEDAGRDPGGRRALERRHAGLVGRDCRNRQAGVDQRLQVRAPAGDEDADHRSSPMTSVPTGASGTTAHMPIPTLKTRLSSSSSTPRSVSQANTGGRSQLSQSMRASTPAGSTRDTLPRMPPPVTCASARTSAWVRSSRTSFR